MLVGAFEKDPGNALALAGMKAAESFAERLLKDHSRFEELKYQVADHHQEAIDRHSAVV